MVAGLALALVLSSPVPLPRPVAPPPATAPVLSEAGPAAGAGQGSAQGQAVAVLPAGRVPLPLARPAAPATKAADAAGAGQGSEAAPLDEDAAGDGSAALVGPAVAGSAAAPAAGPGLATTARAVPIPLPRPGASAASAAPGPPAVAGEKARALASAAGAPRSPSRPEGGAPVVRAMMAVPGRMALRDMVCRDPRISGQPAATFVGGVPGCGIVDPVRVASIAGVRLSAPVTLDCRTARKFADWVTGVAQPAARETLGSGIASIRIMGSYVCRPRNNSPGERLSEHSVGRAVDVGGVSLADGRRIAVLEDWGRGAPGAFLRRLWKGACGGFTTVIGPDGDRHHRDHLHLDAAWRDGTWCR